MKEQIDGKVKEERSQKLIELSNQNEEKYNKNYIGKNIEVLFEEKKDGVYKGHTKNYILAYLPEKKSKVNQLENKLIKVKCINAEKDLIIVEM